MKNTAKFFNNLVLTCMFTTTMLVPTLHVNAATVNAWIDDGDVNTSADLSSDGMDVWILHKEAADKYGATFHLASSSYNFDSYFYHWKYNAATTAHTYNLSVYCGSPLMENTSAHYWIDGTFVGSLNQYTAPAGNNWVGTINDYGLMAINVSSYGTGATGADAVNLWY